MDQLNVKRDELPFGSGQPFEWKGGPLIAVIESDGRIADGLGTAVSICVHERGPLGDGTVGLATTEREVRIFHRSGSYELHVPAGVVRAHGSGPAGWSARAKLEAPTRRTP